MRKFVEVGEEIIQNEASLGGSLTINVTLLFGIIYSLKLSIFYVSQDHHDS